MSFLSRIVPKPKLFQLGALRLYSTNADEESVYTRDEKGKQPKIIHGQEYPSWRQSMQDTPGEFHSKFKLFESDVNRAPLFLKFAHYPMQSWPYRIKKWFSRNVEESKIASQMFNCERLKVLGYDLSTTHFVCFRGGAIRFVGGTEWIVANISKKSRTLNNVPNRFSPGYFVEMIDCENFEDGGVRYEGLENFMFLEYLRWLSLKNNIYIDDWCLDRLSSITTSLEYLDLRGCPVTYRGIQVLHRISNLKLLVLDLKPEEELEQVCALLQEFMPDLLIKFCEPEAQKLLPNKI